MTEKYKFSFQVQHQALAAFTSLKLFNGYNEIVKDGYGNMQVEVPKGIYELVIEVNEHIEKRKYRIDRDISDVLTHINTASSLPARGFSSTHEYFSEPTKAWSRISTISGEPISGSRLFLFLRYSDKATPYDQVAAMEKDFYIVNENRDTLWALGAENVKTHHGQADQYFAATAFHEEVEPGQYYLVYDNRELKCEIPVYVFKNWQTQIFIMCGKQPVFATVRISIEHDGFAWDNPQNIQLDSLASKLHNGIYVLPEDLKMNAADGKWDNPMLGILAAYTYLLSDSISDDAFFDTILHNLENYILDNHSAPDLVALRLLAATHFKKEIPNEPLIAPCMVAAGLDVFRRQSIKMDSLIPANGIVESILTKLRADSIWTTYTPLPYKKPDIPRSRSSSSEKGMGVSPGAMPVPSAPAQIERAEKRFDPEKDWVTSSVFAELIQNQATDVNSIASSLQLTKNTVIKTLNKLNDSAHFDMVATALLGSSNVKENAFNMVNSKIDKLLKF